MLIESIEGIDANELSMMCENGEFEEYDVEVLGRFRMEVTRRPHVEDYIRQGIPLLRELDDESLVNLGKEFELLINFDGILEEYYYDEEEIITIYHDSDISCLDISNKILTRQTDSYSDDGDDSDYDNDYDYELEYIPNNGAPDEL